MASLPFALFDVQAYPFVCGAAFAAGPVIGGTLADELGWRAIFLVNLPVGAIAITLLARLRH